MDSNKVIESVVAMVGENDRVSFEAASQPELVEALHKARMRLDLSKKGFAVDFPKPGSTVLMVYKIGGAGAAPAVGASDPSVATAKAVKKGPIKAAQHTYVPPTIAGDIVAVLSDIASHIVWLVGPTQCGKAQPYDAKVQTPTGPVQMGDLVVGDMVLGGDGRPCMVRGIFEQGLRPVYRAEFDGDEVSTECDLNHNWKYMRRKNMNENRSLKNGKKRSNQNLHKWEVLTTEEIIKVQGLANGEEIEAKRGCVPICGAAEFSGKIPSVFSPYVLGVLLGDGNLSTNGNIGISSADKDILDRVSDELPDGFILRHSANYDYRIKSVSRDGWADKRKSPLKVELARLGLLGTNSFTKFVPDEYKFVDSRSRMELLRGLMDTDGSIGLVSRMEFSTTSERLANDVAWLVRSLGGKCKKTERVTTYTYLGETKSGVKSYRLAVKIMENPFYVSRKACKFYPIKRRKDRILHRIVKVGEKPCRCISVDSPDSTYLTDDFIVTHNTTLLRWIASQMGRKLFRVNCRGDMVSESFLGEKTVSIDPATKQNIVTFQKGAVEQAMTEGLDENGNEVGEPGILYVDEISAAPAHVAMVLNRLFESDDPRRTLVIDQDGGRVVTSHSGFRIVCSANTAGRGANTAEDMAYSAQGDALDLSLINRVAVCMRMGYDRAIEQRIVLEKMADDVKAKELLAFRDAIRKHIKAGKLSTPFSTKRLIDVSNMFRVFNDLGKALYYVLFEFLLPEEKAVYNETAVALIGKDLMRQYTQTGIDYV